MIFPWPGASIAGYDLIDRSRFSGNRIAEILVWPTTTLMPRQLLRIGIFVIAIGFCLLALSDSTFAQCAMCRSGVSQALAKNLNIAVIVLLAPPVTIFSAIFYIAFKNRKG